MAPLSDAELQLIKKDMPNMASVVISKFDKGDAPAVKSLLFEGIQAIDPQAPPATTSDIINAAVNIMEDFGHAFGSAELAADLDELGNIIVDLDSGHPFKAFVALLKAKHAKAVAAAATKATAAKTTGNVVAPTDDELAAAQKEAEASAAKVKELLARKNAAPAATAE